MEKQRLELIEQLSKTVASLPETYTDTAKKKAFASHVACAFKEMSTEELSFLLDTHAFLKRTQEAEGKVLLQQFKGILRDYANVPY